MVILISCSTLSLVLGRDLHSRFTPAPITLSMLNVVLLKGSQAEQSSLCNHLVWFDPPAIESWNKENMSHSISPLVKLVKRSQRLQEAKTFRSFQNHSRKMNVKKNASWTKMRRWIWEETNLVVPTTPPRVTRTCWPLHAWDSMYYACRSTTSITEGVTYHQPSHKTYIYRVRILPYIVFNILSLGPDVWPTIL